jgi:hypothetical protein
MAPEGTPGSALTLPDLDQSKNAVSTVTVPCSRAVRTGHATDEFIAPGRIQFPVQ